MRALREQRKLINWHFVHIFRNLNQRDTCCHEISLSDYCICQKADYAIILIQNQQIHSQRNG
jgi:hypothetical protein